MSGPRLEVLEGGASAEQGRAWALRCMGLAAIALFVVGLPFVAIPAAAVALLFGLRALAILRRCDPLPGARFWAWSGIVVAAAALAVALLLLRVL